MQVDTNIVFEILGESKTRITVMQGGTRSGKTYNIILFFVIKLLQEKGKTLTICRASLPTIKGTVLRDFMDILLKLNLYNEEYHNKTDNTYWLNGNLIEFVSVDQPQKVRGRKRDYLFMNEANEFTYEAWMQLAFRTTTKIVLDYNPSDEYSFIYDKILTRNDADFYITTYKDNPFLPAELVEEIERLEQADENYWRIYGLGQKGVSQDTIYTHWNICEEMPGKGEQFFGQDFGYNNPSALVLIEFYEGIIYVDEWLYQTKLTTSDLIDEYKILGVRSSLEVFADCSEPKTIEEISRAGYNILPSDKDVLEGIRKVKSMPLRVTKRSANIIKELKNYKWKVDKNGVRQDEPVKFNDHAADAIRYGIFTKMTGASASWVAF